MLIVFFKWESKDLLMKVLESLILIFQIYFLKISSGRYFTILSSLLKIFGPIISFTFAECGLWAWKGEHEKAGEMAQWVRVLAQQEWVQVLSIHVRSRAWLCVHKAPSLGQRQALHRELAGHQSSQRWCFQFSENLPQGVRQGAMKEDVYSDLGKCTLEFRCSVLIPHLKIQTHTDTQPTDDSALRISVTSNNFAKESLQYL